MVPTMDSRHVRNDDDDTDLLFTLKVTKIDDDSAEPLDEVRSTINFSDKLLRGHHIDYTKIYECLS